MKTSKRLACLFFALVLTMSLFTGCGQTTKPDETSIQKTAQEQISNETDSTELISAEANSAPKNSPEREITDMAGRTVTIPATTEIDSVFSTGPVAAIFLYMAAPDKLLGWNYELNDTEKSIILEEYQDLPNFGMGDAINYEAVIAANPTIALNCGTINDSMVSECDALSKSLGIPVIAVDNDLAHSAEAFRFLGELLGVKEHCEQLAVYAEQIFADIDTLADIPEEERIRVYYGNGEDSLETAPNGSSHAQILDTIHAVNVADLELGDGSRVQISAEQLFAWNPDVIVVTGEPKADTSGSSAAKAILNNPDYAVLKAVQEQKVYGTPNAPFNWVDRPAGPNRLIGLRWFSTLIYSDYMECDTNEEVHEFFKLFYHIDMTDEQLEKLLNGTL